MLSVIFCVEWVWLTTTWSDWQQTRDTRDGTTTGLPSFHSPYYLLFFYYSRATSVLCDIAALAGLPVHSLFALDQVRLRNEARVDHAQDSTGCCLPEIGIADHHHLQNEFVSVCMHLIHIHGSTPSSAMSCRVTHTRAMPRLGLGSTMCCIYSYWPTVAARRLVPSEE